MKNPYHHTPPAWAIMLIIGGIMILLITMVISLAIETGILGALTIVNTFLLCFMLADRLSVPISKLLWIRTWQDNDKMES